MADKDNFSAPSSFHEQQRELCKLSEYIKEKESFLQEFVDKLGYTTWEELQMKPQMVQCPYNKNHFVPETTLQRHAELCQYVTMGMDRKFAEEYLETRDFSYEGVDNIASVTIDSSICQAVSQYVRNKQITHDSHMTTVNIHLLEDHQDVPLEILQSNDPIVIIRYMKSWRQIPRSYCVLPPSSIHPITMKSWMFNNLPDNHVYQHETGGELHVVEDILHHIYATPTLTPNMLSDRIHPLLYTNTERFVLSFWKFICILRIQQQHNIHDKTVEELLPLSLVSQTSQDSRGTSATLVSEIQALAKCTEAPPTRSTHQCPLPAVYHSYHMSPEERKILYDYTIELSREKLGRSKDYINDPDLIRDDIKSVTKKQKDNENEDDKSYLEVLKDMRDYRRRRQSYRAKNVHITKKTPKQIFHDIIETRMKEIRSSLGLEEDEDEKEHKVEEILEEESPGNQYSSQSREGRHNSDRGYSPHTKTIIERRSHSRSRSRERRKSHSKIELERSRVKKHKRSRSHDSHKRLTSHDRHKKSHDRRSRSRSRSRSKDEDVKRKHKHKSKHKHHDKS